MKIIMIKGVHNSGKTSLVTKVIEELVSRGYSVGTIKDIHAEKFQMDHPGTDTYLHHEAGARLVAARGLFETDFLYTGRLDAAEMISYFTQDYLVVEGDPGLACANLVTGITESDLDYRKDENTIGFGGIIGNTMSEYMNLPVFHTANQIKEIVDLIEVKAMEEKKKLQERTLKLYFDGEEVPMVPFVESIIRASVLGIVGELKGFKEDTEVRIEL